MLETVTTNGKLNGQDAPGAAAVQPETVYAVASQGTLRLEQAGETCPFRTATGITVFPWNHGSESTVMDHNSPEVAKWLKQDVPNLRSLGLDSQRSKDTYGLEVTVTEDPDGINWNINAEWSTYSITTNDDHDAKAQLFNNLPAETLQNMVLLAGDLYKPVIETNLDILRKADQVTNKLSNVGLGLLGATGAGIAGFFLYLHNQERKYGHMKISRRRFLKIAAGGLAAGVACEVAWLLMQVSKIRDLAADRRAELHEFQDEIEICQYPADADEGDSSVNMVDLRNAVVDYKIREYNRLNVIAGSESAMAWGNGHLVHRDFFDRDPGYIRDKFAEYYKGFLEQAKAELAKTREDLNGKPEYKQAYAGKMEFWIKYFTELMLNYTCLDVIRVSNTPDGNSNFLPIDQLFFPELLADLGFQYDPAVQETAPEGAPTDEKFFAVRAARISALKEFVLKEFVTKKIH